MPVSGLVVTLAADADADAVGRALSVHGGIALGAPCGARLPVTLVTDDAASHGRALDALEHLPGIAFVDVVFHDFADVLVAPSDVVRRRERSRRHAAS